MLSLAKNHDFDNAKLPPHPLWKHLNHQPQDRDIAARVSQVANSPLPYPLATNNDPMKDFRMGRRGLSAGIRAEYDNMTLDPILFGQLAY